jgi:hypothetical protein
VHGVCTIEPKKKKYGMAAFVVASDDEGVCIVARLCKTESLAPLLCGVCFFCKVHHGSQAVLLLNVLIMSTKEGRKKFLSVEDRNRLARCRSDLGLESSQNEQI